MVDALRRQRAEPGDEGGAERVTAEHGSRRFKVVDPPDADTMRRAGELYAAKYDYSADFINFVVRPRIAYGWRAENVKTATKWTF